MTKRQRLNAINELARVIGSCGRRFFHHQGRYGRAEVGIRGRIWWVDEYTGFRIYTHRTSIPSRWPGFSHGGTLRQLVEHFREYIVHGTPVPCSVFGPWPDWICASDLWGYGDDMQQVRDAAERLGIIATPAKTSDQTAHQLAAGG